nr:rhomboid family intramembrane serine protease [Vibrio neptunius]
MVLSTVVVSFCVNFQITGSLFGKASITELEPFGGLTYQYILQLDLWRLAVSQLIHVKQYHMIYNALSLFALGCILERKIGASVFLSVWFMSGVVGTLASTFTVLEPWNLGTGGSQAILGLAGAGLVMFLKREIEGKLVVAVLTFTIVPAFALDVVFSESHLPKLGHVVSFTVGVVLSHCFQLSGKGRCSPLV